MTVSETAATVVVGAYRRYLEGRADQALAMLAAAGEAVHGHPAGQLLRGVIDLDRRRPVPAERAFRRAILLDPGLGRAYGNAAAALRRANRLDAALAAGRRALLLEPANPAVRNTVSAVLVDLDRPAEALAVADELMAVAPDDAEAVLNRGLALQRLGRFDEARAAYDAACAGEPANPAAVHARSYLRLLLGEMPEGWREREARWGISDQAQLQSVPGVPLWTGEPLNDLRVLVVGDEGRGDMIQYARFLRRPPFDRARSTLLVPAYMVRLFAAALPGVELCASRPDGPVDYQTPLSRIPAVLGTDLGSIPCEVPYLIPEPELVVRWRRRIGSHGFRIAVCWQGNPGTPIDRGRSIPLAAFAPLAAIPGVRLIALQARHGTEQLAALPDGVTVETLGDDYDAGPASFVDPAAVASAVDLVVSSDTALAHLAGALGAPVWLALRRVPDFRWLLDRDDSPWYPTMRIFRQRREGDWAEVMRRIADAVRPLADGSGRLPC